MGATTVLSGWVTATLIVISGGVFLAMVVGGLLAAVVTISALPRLPVVRTFLVRCYRLDDDTLPSDPSFRWRHAAAILLVGGMGYLIGAVGYVVSTSFYSLPFYPVLFVVVSVFATLVTNRTINSWAPVRSLRRAAIEWTVFFVMVSVSYTAMVVVWVL